MAMLDGTVVTIALRRIGTDLDATMGDLQWVVNGYLLALASLILVAGSLGDRLGRRRLYLFGIGWFAVASLACAPRPNPDTARPRPGGSGHRAALMTRGARHHLRELPARIAHRRSAPGRASRAWLRRSGPSSVASSLTMVAGVDLPHQPAGRGSRDRVMHAVRPRESDLTATEVTDRGGAALTITGLAALTLGLIGGSNWPPAAPLLVLVGVALLVAFVAWNAAGPRRWCRCHYSPPGCSARPT